MNEAPGSSPESDEGLLIGSYMRVTDHRALSQCARRGFCHSGGSIRIGASCRREAMNDKPPEPVLGSDTLRDFRRGVEEFNSGKFFECHDTLEDVWRGVRGPARPFFQGLIQAAVGFYHLGNGNRIGADSQLEKALAKLLLYSERYLGMEVELFRRDLHEWLIKIRGGEELRATIADLPKLHFTENHWMKE